MKEKLGQILRDERNKRNMSQNDFAHYLELERSTYECIENNRIRDLKTVTVVKLLDKLNLDLELFLPKETIDRYFELYYCKNDVNLKPIIQREVLKLLNSVDSKFEYSNNPI
jgi:transcriptional regulator with XRE-family HTH domain